MKNYLIEKDSLALALTRSPMFMGIPMRLFFANIMLGTLICIDAHTFLGIPWMLVMLLLLVKFSLKDPIFFTVWMKSFIKTPPVMNSHYWGKTNTYTTW